MADNDQAAQAAQPAQNVVVQPGPAGQLNLKIEQSKLPVFYGIKTKDTITAAHMIDRVTALQATNAWSDADTYHHFSLALQGTAQEWLRTQNSLGDNPAKTWTYIMPLFRANFATQEDDFALLDQLRSVAMRSQETVTDYGNRVHRITELLTDKFNRPPRAAAAAANGQYTDAEVDAIELAMERAVFKFMALQVFRAGLPKDLRAVVSQQKPATFARAFELARDQAQIRDSTKAISAIEEDEPQVEAVQFRPQTQRQNWNRKPNNSGGNYSTYNRQQQQQPRPPYNSNTTSYRGPGNNSNNNKIICVYCKKQNHHQDQCRKRITDKQPCVSSNGKPYWPRTVNAVDNADALPEINTITGGTSGFPYRA